VHHLVERVELQVAGEGRVDVLERLDVLRREVLAVEAVLARGGFTASLRRTSMPNAFTV
jgi:hypothetical protein